MNLFIETPQQAAARRRRAGASSAEEDESDPLMPGWETGDSHERSASSSSETALKSRLFSRSSFPDQKPEPSTNSDPETFVPSGEYSVAQQSYREELAFAKRRARHRKFAQLMRSLLLVIVIPFALCAVFLASYALTCILNGATPQEVVALFGGLIKRIEGFILSMS